MLRLWGGACLSSTGTGQACACLRMPAVMAIGRSERRKTRFAPALPRSGQCLLFSIHPTRHGLKAVAPATPARTQSRSVQPGLTALSRGAIRIRPRWHRGAGTPTALALSLPDFTKAGRPPPPPQTVPLQAPDHLVYGVCCCDAQTVTRPSPAQNPKVQRSATFHSLLTPSAPGKAVFAHRLSFRLAAEGYSAPLRLWAQALGRPHPGELAAHRTAHAAEQVMTAVQKARAGVLERDVGSLCKASHTALCGGQTGRRGWVDGVPRGLQKGPWHGRSVTAVREGPWRSATGQRGSAAALSRFWEGARGVRGEGGEPFCRKGFPASPRKKGIHNKTGPVVVVTRAPVVNKSWHRPTVPQTPLQYHRR